MADKNISRLSIHRRHTRLSIGLLALAMAVIMPALPVIAQSGAGTVQGTIEDSTGAVIPGVTVHVVNLGTGVMYDTVSNGAGFYSVPSLFAGNYTITFTANSMKKFQQSIALQDAQNAVINPILQPGSVNEQVTVQGNEIQLATYDSGTISTQLDFNRINQLPMNGRNVLTLAGETTPGLESGGQRANGNMPEGLEYTQDGAPMTNRGFGGEGNSANAQLPDPDTVQEVKLETSNSSAQFATPATGIITTKSGTNGFHGSVFETARNNAIGIAKARQDPSNLKAPHYVRNEFGANIGGPIIIPKLYDGRNKSFFFFAYERYSLRSFQSENVTVPTTAMRNGDYSQLINKNNVLQTVYDPATTNPVTHQRLAFPNNAIPGNRESPLAKNLYAISPLPTSADNPLLHTNFVAPGINNATIPNITFRLDHVINENNHVYLRFTDINQDLTTLRNYPSNTPASIAGAGLSAGATNLSTTPITTISAALGFTHIFSPSFYSETIVSQEWFSQYFNGGPASFTNVGQLFGLPDNFGELGFPTITGGVMPYGGSQFNYGISQIITNFDENLTKIIGRHQLQFGGRYRHERFGYLPDRFPDATSFGACNGSVPCGGYASANLDPTSGAQYAAQPNTGLGDADLFLGAASSYQVSLSAPYEHYREQEVDTYFQDNFHVSRNLTINAGLRWEAHPAPHTADGLLESFDLKNKAIVQANPMSFYVNKGYTTQAIATNLNNIGVKFETPDAAGIPQAMLYDYNFTFSPRIGIAWSPFGTGRHGTVIRGGYGRYIYPVPIRNSVKIAAPNQPFAAIYSQSYIVGNQSPDGQNNYLIRNPQPVVAGLNSSSVVNTGTVNSILPGINMTTLDPHYQPDFVTQVNATIEQPLPGASVLRITYLLDHGEGLDQEYMYNNFPSNYVYESTTGMVPPGGALASTALGPYDNTVYGSSDVLDMKTGWSNDNSLQVNFQRQFKHGYAYQIFYTFSRAYRLGGNYFRDGILYPAADYLPGIIPVNPGSDITQPSHELDRFENYKLDAAIPEHRVGFNGIVDLPIGRGKMLFRNANRFVDEMIGGYQIAYNGTVVSQMFQPSAGNWGPTNPIKVYKQAKPVNDCRSGVCRKEYLWFNGYIPTSAINATKNGISGLPSDYVPFQTPIHPATGDNNATVTLKNGSVVTTAYNPGPSGAHPFSKTFINGPFNYNADVSLFKVFPIKESMSLRVNVDAFNAFNIQGYVNPSASDGTELLTSSYWTPRQIQLTARFTF
jgi:hypothetical protein